MVGPTLVLAGFVALLVGTECFFAALAALNVRHGRRAVEREREWVTGTLGVEDPEELSAYHRVGTGFGQLRSLVGLAVLLLVVPTGLFGELVAAAGGLGLAPVVEGTVVIVGGLVAVRLLSLPFDAVDTFAVEEAFGFNEQTPRLWVRDAAVGTLVTVAFTTPVVAAVLWLLSAFPAWWWVGAWAVLLGVSVAMLVVYPRVIAPLFNEFTPIESGDLREAVEEVFDCAGVTVSQLYEMDASRRSSHSNAYFVGFGRTKRVVLFDTLIDQLELPSLQAVLAHELAHWREHHVWYQLGATAVRLGVVLAVLSVLVDAPVLYEAFGLPADATYAGLVVAMLAVEPLLRLTAPLENRLSLRHERAADDYAVEVMGEGEPMVAALAALTSENLSNPFPHPLYEAFHYTHPPVPERIRRLRDADG